MSPERQRVLQAAQGASLLHLAYVGVANRLFETLREVGSATPEALAEAAGADDGYVRRWCEAAYAHELLDLEAGRFSVAPLGAVFDREAEGSLMPMAVHTMIGAHLAERAAGCMRTGERPGERVLGERPTVVPLFGPMLEGTFARVFEERIAPAVPAFSRLEERAGLAVDLGCGNGWYLRALARTFPDVRGIGLDQLDANIEDAEARTAQEGLGGRLRFKKGDLHHFAVDEPVDLIGMNRALHHVWDEKESVFGILRDHLAPGGSAVIWEPRWPEAVEDLRGHPRSRGMAAQNLYEHVQGNHFLRPEEIEREMERVGLRAETYLFEEGHEAVVVGTRSA